MARLRSHLAPGSSPSKLDEQMVLVFSRTGERRYGIEVLRSRSPALAMNPAPGYNERLPHDMMHLVVEAKLGITRGIFGQLAAGGDAGTFHLALTRSGRSRAVARTATRVKARGRKLLKEGRDDLARSERATYICWQEWLARSQSQDLGAVRKTGGIKKPSDFTEIELDEICEHLDQLSSHWSSLAVGESVAVRWPDLAVGTKGQFNVMY